jgi:hypothetical protein
MRNGSFRHALSVGIDQTNLMALARPVDAHKPFNLFRHAQALLSHHSHPGRRNERQSLYWRSKRNLPRDFRRGRPAGAQVLSRCSKHWDSQATPGRPARPASLRCRLANSRFEGYKDSNPWSLCQGELSCRATHAEGRFPPQTRCASNCPGACAARRRSRAAGLA